MFIKNIVFGALATVFTLVIIIGSIFATNVYLGYRSYSTDLELLKDLRVVRLREKLPNSTRIRTVSKQHLNNSDGLDPKKVTHIRVDKNGFIMPSKVHENPDLSIVFLGGSTTASSFVDEDNRFPYATAKYLEKDFGMKVNAYNGGQGGNHSMHSNINLYAKVIPLQPQIVVLMHNINDLATLMIEGTYWNSNVSRKMIVSFQDFRAGNEISTHNRSMGESIFFQWFPHIAETLREPIVTKDEWANKRGKKALGIDKFYLVNQFKNSLRSFITTARAWNIVPVLMTQPNRFTEKPDEIVRTTFKKFENEWGINYDDYRDLYLDFQKAIRAVAKENSIVLVDLGNKIQKNSRHIYDNVHLTDVGSLAVADEIRKTLSNIIEYQKDGTDPKVRIVEKVSMTQGSNIALDNSRN